MPALKPDHISPTPEEAIMIQAGIDADPDARELDDEWFAQARPAKGVLPPALYAALTDKSKPAVFRHVTDTEHAARVDAIRRRGRHKSAAPKKKINVRLSPASPARLPAHERSWHGDPPTTTSILPSAYPVSSKPEKTRSKMRSTSLALA